MTEHDHEPFMAQMVLQPSPARHMLASGLLQVASGDGLIYVASVYDNVPGAFRLLPGEARVLAKWLASAADEIEAGTTSGSR